MESKIHLLDDKTKNMIAAGEVIERPASVLKELVENSLDSGARRIAVECEGAGTRMIRVMDDGSGMSPEDAELAFCRHSTSKIDSADDLLNISTMGFRGEALPSIASVSRFELETRASGSDAGTLMVVEGGRTVEKSAVARAVGTSATVRNLFFNVPARRKFLKSDRTELRHMVRTLTSIALAQIETGFRLVHEGRELLSVQPCDSVARRVEEIYGRKRGKRYLPVLHERGDSALGGLIEAPETVGSRTGEQYLFINRRPFGSRALTHAVRQAYQSTIPDSGQPSFFLFLTLDPHEVDINVHPAKLEVRFRDEGLAFSLVHRAVQEGLRQEGAIPALDSRDSGKLFAGMDNAERPPGNTRGSVVRDSVLAALRSEGGFQTSFLMPVSPRRGKEGGEKPESTEALFPSGTQSATPVSAGEEPAGSDRPLSADEVLPSIWQLHDRYIFAETKTGCLIIDQHAAHERILYEQIMRGLAGDSVSRQRLLFPVTFHLDPEEHLAVNDFRGILEQAGFEVEDFSGRAVVVRSVPAIRNLGNVEEYFRDLLRDLNREGQGSTGTRHQMLARALACRGAIKAGKELSQREMNELIDKLFATELPYADVHGRNTIICLGLDELNKRFGRH